MQLGESRKPGVRIAASVLLFWSSSQVELSVLIYERGATRQVCSALCMPGEELFVPSEERRKHFLGRG